MGEAKRRSGLPTLRERLEKMGSFDQGARDQFADFADWVERMLQQQVPADDDRALAMLKMVQNASLAIVESSNYAIYEIDLDVAQTAALMCRSLGVAFGYSLMSLAFKDNAPVRDLVRPLTEEFRIGVKIAIDECADTMASADG